MTGRLDRLTLLATFVRIAERGSLSAAARDMDVSQASVSRQLAALEDMLGAPLIARTTHALSLTSDGRAAMADARRMLGEWDALAERTGRAALRGTLRVVAPVALGQTVLMPAALGFLAEHPGVTLGWRLTDEPVRFAEEGCDVWVRVGPVPDDTLLVREAASVERLVVAAPDLAGRHADAPLSDWPWEALGPYEGSRIALRDGDGAETAFAARPRLATDNVVALREAAMAGLAAAILPRWFVADALAGGRLVDAAPSLRAARLPVHVATAAGTRRPARVERFVEAIGEALAGLRSE